MKILIAGSRNYNDYEEFSDIINFLIKNYTNVELISGGARGADSLAERYAKEMHLPIKIFKADWEQFGNKAGFKRNFEMHDYISKYTERLCICFWDGESRGTKHNFSLCNKFNTKLIVYNYKIHRKIEV